MKEYWVKTTKRLLDKPTISADYTSGLIDQDLVLAGRYGCMWPYSEGKYYVMVDSVRLAKKYPSQVGSLYKGEESGFIIDESEALDWVDRIKVPHNRISQIKLMKKRKG